MRYWKRAIQLTVDLDCRVTKTAVDMVRRIDSPLVSFLYCAPHTFHMGGDIEGVMEYAGGLLTHGGGRSRSASSPGLFADGMHIPLSELRTMHTNRAVVDAGRAMVDLWPGSLTTASQGGSLATWRTAPSPD